ncbi:MAG TPA: deoxyribose-phosphate aldolase [Bacillota bacterium]|jgi:deoxyribose-phosphate aldolase
MLTRKSLARMIDHTLLKAQATARDIINLCEEAKEYGFASVCINPGHVALAVANLEGSEVEVCTVIGFPLGATTTATKAAEAGEAVLTGAGEVDMVLNVGALKGGRDDLVERDIRAVVEAGREAFAKRPAGPARPAPKEGGHPLVKVIIEACYLTDEEKARACQAAVRAGADFVKTSTGFGTGGATLEDVRLMRQTVGPDLGVKAAGGIRTLNDALAMIGAGATRLGASAGAAIIKEFDARRGPS